MISEFFAVTVTSVYHIRERAGDEYGGSARKIALKGESRLLIGAMLEQGNGRLIAIGRSLLAYLPERYGRMNTRTGYEREPAQVNSEWHEGKSSPIIALFAGQEEAMRCFESEDLQPADERWLDSTKKILEKIGDDHPVFVISHQHGNCLLPELAAT